jgi:hypothetical protein
MKTILVLNNIFSADMIKDFDYIKRNLDMTKYSLISPLSFMSKDGKYDTENFTVKLISSAIAIGNMYNSFGTISTIIDKNKTVIYFGIAHQNVKADSIFVVNKVTLDTQEFLLDKYLTEAKVRFPFIKSSEAEKEFNNIEELVVHLNGI